MRRRYRAYVKTASAPELVGAIPLAYDEEWVVSRSRLTTPETLTAPNVNFLVERPAAVA